MNIVVKYSCHACGLKRVDLSVRARESEEVTTWMDATVRAVAADHRRRSPSCRATTLSELMIPTTGTSKVGGPTMN